MHSKGEKRNLSPTEDPYNQYPDEANQDASLEVQCPPHTTERKLMTKIDFRVIPILCILYLLAFLDRVNIANANVYGMSNKDQLNLNVNNRYNTALVIFFVPYVLFEIPSNVLLKKFKPHVWLSACMFLFGLVTVIQGLVTSYGGLLTTRFFLGLFETGMFPGCFYILGMYYRREEAQRRYSFFFSSTTLAGAFGGLLASAIGKLDHVYKDYRAWRWIFILEGVLTCVVAIAFFFCIPDFPEDAKWLTKEERAFVKARLQAEQGNSAVERKIKLRDVGRTLGDYKIILGAFMYFGLIVPAYGYAYFSPGIIRGFGYSPIQTQLHSVPPWAVAFGLAMISAFASDKLRHRFGVAIFCICISITGFVMLLTIHTNLHARYAALFLCAAGTYSAMPIIVCWFNMNLGGHARRAIGSGWQIGFGNTGGIIAVFAFLSKEAPRYTKGYSLCIAFACLSALSCTGYLLACWSQNRRREKEVTHANMSETEKAELGDLNPEYRYMY